MSFNLLTIPDSYLTPKYTPSRGVINWMFSVENYNRFQMFNLKILPLKYLELSFMFGVMFSS